MAQVSRSGRLSSLKDAATRVKLRKDVTDVQEVRSAIDCSARRSSEKSSPTLGTSYRLSIKNSPRHTAEGTIVRNSVAYIRALSAAGVDMDHPIETPISTGIPIHTGRYIPADYMEFRSTPIDSRQTALEHENIKNFDPASKLESLVAKLWLNEGIGKAIRMYYEGKGSEALTDLTNTTISAESLNFRTVVARSQLWKALILHDMERPAEIPELLADVMWLVYEGDGKAADYYQFRKMLLGYSEETWQQLKLKKISEDSINHNADVEIDFHSDEAQAQYRSWISDLDDFLDAHFNHNDWPDPEDAIKAPNTKKLEASVQTWLKLETRYSSLTSEYERLLAENHKLKVRDFERGDVDHEQHGEFDSLSNVKPERSLHFEHENPAHAQPDLIPQHCTAILDSATDIDLIKKPLYVPRERKSPAKIERTLYMKTSSQLSPKTRQIRDWVGNNHDGQQSASSKALKPSPNRQKWGTPRVSYTLNRSGSVWSSIGTLPLHSSASYSVYRRNGSDQSLFQRCAKPEPLRIQKGERSKKRRSRNALHSRDIMRKQVWSNVRVPRKTISWLSRNGISIEQWQAILDNFSSPDAQVTSLPKLHVLRRARNMGEGISPHALPHRSANNYADFAFDHPSARPQSPRMKARTNDKVSSTPLEALVLELNENDIPLTDTPSPTKLEQNIPNFHEHQEQRRRSQSQHVIPAESLPSQSYETERRRAFEVIKNTSSLGCQDSRDIASTLQHIERSKATVYLKNAGNITLTDKQVKVDKSTQRVPGGQITSPAKSNRAAAPLTPSSKSPPSSAVSKLDVDLHAEVSAVSAKNSSANLAPVASALTLQNLGQQIDHHRREVLENLAEEGLESNLRDANNHHQLPQHFQQVSSLQRDDAESVVESSSDQRHQDYRDSLRISTLLEKLQKDQAAAVGHGRRASQPTVSSPLRQNLRASDDDSDELGEQNTSKPERSITTESTNDSSRMARAHPFVFTPSASSEASNHVAIEQARAEAFHKLDGSDARPIIIAQTTTNSRRSMPKIDQTIRVANDALQYHSRDKISSLQDHMDTSNENRNKRPQHEIYPNSMTETPDLYGSDKDNKSLRPQTFRQNSMYDDIEDAYPSPVKTGQAVTHLEQGWEANAHDFEDQDAHRADTVPEEDTGETAYADDEASDVSSLSEEVGATQYPLPPFMSDGNGGVNNLSSLPLEAAFGNARSARLMPSGDLFGNAVKSAKGERSARESKQERSGKVDNGRDTAQRNMRVNRLSSGIATNF